MIVQTFLGMTKNEWDFVNSFSNWLSAAGTLAAVWVSLHLANRSTTPKAKISVGHRIVMQTGPNAQQREFVVFRIVNVGERVIHVTQLGWQVGLWTKRYAVQMYDETMSSKLPIELAHGQEACWYVPLALHEEPWPTYFAKKMLMPGYRTSCRTLRGQFHTSLGRIFVAVPERNLISKLRDACQSLALK